MGAIIASAIFPAPIKRYDGGIAEGAVENCLKKLLPDLCFNFNVEIRDMIDFCKRLFIV